MAPSAPKLRLTYFDGPWLAEPIRNAFLLGDVEFVDERITGGDWATLKPAMPFGSLPILTVDDDKVYSQSDAILRYAGILSGLYPSAENILDSMKIDEVLGGLQDLFKASSTDKSAAAMRAAEEEGIPRYARGLDKMYAEYNTSGPYLFGDKITIADCKLSMVLYMIVNYFKLNEKCLDQFTHLLAANKAFIGKVNDIKQSKE